MHHDLFQECTAIEYCFTLFKINFMHDFLKSVYVEYRRLRKINPFVIKIKQMAQAFLSACLT